MHTSAFDYKDIAGRQIDNEKGTFHIVLMPIILSIVDVLVVLRRGVLSIVFHTNSLNSRHTLPNPENIACHC